MGSGIAVESKVGEGTLLRFSAYFDLPKTRFGEPPPFKAVDVTGLRVLVVDDSATNRKILEEMIANWGMEPTGVKDAKSALAAMEQPKVLGLPWPKR
jgi:PleD family two-component response regulator